MTWRRIAQGFTLLEVLVAMAVLAIALSAIVVNGGRFASNASSLRDKSLALWVARNRLTEIELAPAWPTTGKSNDDVKMGGTEWTWRVEVKETADPSLHRIDIRVEKKGEKNRNAYATLSGFLSKVGRPS